MSLQYADIKMYVFKITYNALGTAQTTTQGWNHAKSHEARDARQFCKSPTYLISNFISFWDIENRSYIFVLIIN